jgi:hypothetical protein
MVDLRPSDSKIAVLEATGPTRKPGSSCEYVTGRA